MKKAIKKYSVIPFWSIVFVPFLLILLMSINSFVNPPEGRLSSEFTNDDLLNQYGGELGFDSLIFQKNTNYLDNFEAQYKNTILSWFNKDRNLEEYYVPTKFLKISKSPFKLMFFKLGQFLPYILLISIVLLFVFKKEISEEQKS
jgi:hypothetical protein